MTVRENVAFPLSVRRVPAAEANAAVEDALRVVGLGALAERHPSQLSGGQQQRVALARAIVGSPRVLLFDEPLSNLDAKLREGMRGEIRALQRRLGIATVYVTHDREEALSMSDRVIVMDQGRIAQIGTPRELYRRPASRFVADFVGKVSFVPVTRDGSGAWRAADGTRIVADGDGAFGATAVAALRPVAIRLTRAGDVATDVGAPRNQFAGRVVEAHYTGPSTEYVVDAAGASIRAHAQLELDPGAAVTLSVAPADVALLPAD
jgi:ABC-type Fe3+/spermidine/putrescine transport system ATPase subunit